MILVKSAVAMLNMSPRPMLSRALLKLTSEFRVNLPKAHTIFVSACNQLTGILTPMLELPPPWHGQLPFHPPQLLPPLLDPLAAQVRDHRAQRHFGLHGRHQEHGQRIAFIRNLDDIVVNAFSGHELACGLKKLNGQVIFVTVTRRPLYDG